MKHAFACGTNFVTQYNTMLSHRFSKFIFDKILWQVLLSCFWNTYQSQFNILNHGQMSDLMISFILLTRMLSCSELELVLMSLFFPCKHLERHNSFIKWPTVSFASRCFETNSLYLRCSWAYLAEETHLLELFFVVSSIVAAISSLFVMVLSLWISVTQWILATW